MLHVYCTRISNTLFIHLLSFWRIFFSVSLSFLFLTFDFLILFVYFIYLFIFFFFVSDLSRAQRTLSKSLGEFNFECIGSTQTDDEQVIVDSLKQFSKLIANIEDERDNMVKFIHGKKTKFFHNFINYFIVGPSSRSDSGAVGKFSQRSYWRCEREQEKV